MIAASACLRELSRTELQAVAKSLGVRANQRTEAIIAEVSGVTRSTLDRLGPAELQALTEAFGLPVSDTDTDIITRLIDVLTFRDEVARDGEANGRGETETVGAAAEAGAAGSGDGRVRDQGADESSGADGADTRPDADDPSGNSNTVSVTMRIDASVPRRVARRRMRPSERQYIWGQTHGCCYMCREFLPEKSGWHIEHVLAFSSDPARHDVLGNMLAACATCNLKKLDRPLQQVVQSFACNLDSDAAGASHLNSSARQCLLHALDLKHRLYHADPNGVRADAPRLDVTDVRVQGEGSGRGNLGCRLHVGSVPSAGEAGDGAVSAPGGSNDAVSAPDGASVDAALDAVESAVACAARYLLPADAFDLDLDQKPHRGSFGEVFKAEWRREAGTAEVAVKFSRQIDGAGGLLSAELDALRHLAVSGGSAHIIVFHGVVWMDQRLGLVFDWCDFDLSDRPVARNADLTELIAQAADALGWLHQRSYLHRDVKPMNILVDHPPHAHWGQARAKLADFGLAKRSVGDEHTHNVGTGVFRAPESRDGRYYPATDVYALGKTMAHLHQQGVAPLFRSRSAGLDRWAKVQGGCTAAAITERLGTGDVARLLRAPPGLTRIQEGVGSGAPVEAGEAAPSDPPASPSLAPCASAGTERVFVSENARTEDGTPGKKRGMKYHVRRGCYRSWKETTLEVAEAFGHEQCGKCSA